MSKSELVSPQHLQRKALIYIRQSTPHQVHLQSGELTLAVCPAPTRVGSGLEAGGH